MDMEFLYKLQFLRDMWNKKIIIISGYRCATWNIAVGGSPKSQHLLGRAADLHLNSPWEGKVLALLASRVGMGGIGVANTFIHVDSGPANRRWDYPIKSAS